jgi:hypothetical protein
VTDNGRENAVFRDASSNLKFFDFAASKATNLTVDASDLVVGDVTGDGKDDVIIQDTNDNLKIVNVFSESSSGNALVEFDSGIPTDIDSYDLATFQATPDGETVTVDVEDANGNVLLSDISKDTDISGISTSKNVKLRANLARTNTANNPTVDFLARRFTR